MTPPLPPELLSEILGWATVSDWPSERQHMRNQFRLVGRAWHNAFGYWRDIDVPDLGALANLCTFLNLLGPGPDKRVCAAQIRTLTLHLIARRDEHASRAARLLPVAVLKAATGVETLELSVYRRVVRNRGAVELDPVVVEGLCGLLRVRHLTFFLHGTGNCLDLPIAQLNRLAHSWPELVSVNVNRFALSDSPGLLSSASAQLEHLAALQHLRSIRVERAFSHHALGAYLRSLPPCLTALALDDLELYDTPEFAQAVCSNFPAHAERLTDVALLDRKLDGQDSEGFIDRGVFGGLLAGLVSVRRLAISPWAVKDLANALVPLRHLTELAVQQGFGTAEASLSEDELVRLIRHSKALRRLVLCRETR